MIRDEKQEQADALPQHPVLGRWLACQCGHPVCKRVYPSSIGSFYEGSGFEPDEVRTLVAAMKGPEAKI